MVRRRKIKETTNKHWSSSQRLEAAKVYVLTGNYTKTAAVTGIPYDTIKNWRQSDWWKKYVDELSHESDVELSARMQKLMSKALTVVEDRLDNGNHQFDQKSGELIRVPVNAKDSMKIASDLQNQRDKIIDKPKQQEIQETLEAHLLKLAERFQAFSRQPNAIEAKVVETTYEVIKELAQ